MMWATSSIIARIGFERSGIEPIATEKNTAKLKIWRISLCAIASAIEVGIRWVRNFSIEKAETGKPVDCPAAGSVPGKFAPGWSRLTMMRPSSSDTKEALMNQPMVLAKMRPSREPLPICAMPPTRVANTSGAMIILIRRRNIMAIRLMEEAQSALVSGRKLKIAAPMTMPSTIAARMYCVNLFDIERPPLHRPLHDVADMTVAQHGLRALAMAGCSRCETGRCDLAFMQRTTNAACTF